MYERMLVSGLCMGGSCIFYARYSFYFEEMCVSSEVCVRLGVRAEGVGEKTKECDKLL